MTDKIRWFRCVVNGRDLTEGKLYSATIVDSEGDLCIADDVGDMRWVVITESHKFDKDRTPNMVNPHFEEVIPDD